MREKRFVFDEVSEASSRRIPAKPGHPTWQRLPALFGAPASGQTGASFVTGGTLGNALLLALRLFLLLMAPGWMLYVLFCWIRRTS